MKKVLCLFSVLAFLLSSPAIAHDMTDVGVDVKIYKVFDFDDLGLSISVAPTWPELDTSLRFDRIDPGTSGTDLAYSQHERLHAHLIDAGHGSITMATITS